MEENMRHELGNRTDIDVKNLCSRKLYELCAASAVAPSERAACLRELEARRHYLDQLSRLYSASPLAQLH